MKGLSSFIVITTMLLHSSAYAQKNNPTTYWSNTIESTIEKNGERRIVPDKYQTVQINLQVLKNYLSNAPKGYDSEEKLDFIIPTPEGKRSFKISETPIFSSDIEKTVTGIKTFSGYDINNPNDKIKIDYTPIGFHAMVLTHQGGGIFIDPYQTNDQENYIVYYKNNLENTKPFGCSYDDLVDKSIENNTEAPLYNRAQGDCQLRTFRLAIACTGEYATYHGGTQALAQAAIVTTMNRVNGIFERDMAITMNIISGTDIIYTNSGSDPYTNNNGSAMLSENQTEIDGAYGSANYDIGHVFSTGGGGVAYQAACVNGWKAGGVTGSSAPTGDPFDIDYVAHEMGHQYGADHTFNSTNGNCATRVAARAYEPGSGTTIMAYAGICGASNVQSNSDALFHSTSINQMSAYVISGSGTCGALSSSGNSEPVAAAGGNYTIPASTPFQLTGSVTDADGADVHTYTWEQYDLGASQNQPTSTSTTQPNFRSYLPSSSPTRYFPQLSDILAGNNSTQWEMMPTVSRTMTFRFTTRDNSTGGYGCTDSDDMTVTTDGGSGPFVVTYPNASGITWTGGTSETVTWNVAGTTTSPVSCANVDILLSTDGGSTFPYTLASNTPNDGTQSITVPNLPTTTARVKVICNGNIFFDISNNDFTITATPTSDPEISFTTTSVSSSESASPDGDLDCRPYTDYTVTMEIANPPTGDATVTIGTSGTATNLYDYQIIGSPLTFADGSTTSQSFTIRVIDDAVIEGAESVTLSYTISGSTDAVAGSFNQTSLVSISDDDSAPVSGASPFYTEDFESFGGFVGLATTTGWSRGGFLTGNETWVVTGNGNLGTQSAHIATTGAPTTLGYDNSTASNYLIRTPAIDGTGRSGMVLTFDFIANGSNDDFGTLYYSTAPSSGITFFEGSSAGPYSGVTSKVTRSVNLPASLDGTTFYLWWEWDNDGDGNGAYQPFEIDNIKITEGALGTQIESSVTASSDNQYLGPNQSIYFYNPADGDLMMYIQNTSAHDYGCTTVEIDRAGTGATQFQATNTLYDVTDKTFRVIPTTNNASGTYDVTAYYTETEIAGWETATGNTRTNLDIVKTSGNISAVTPSTPQVNTTFFSTATLGAFGGDVTASASFSNGFSGFGLGEDAGVLTINGLEFKGKLENNYSFLTWKMESIKSVIGFDIEFAEDGKNFTHIGYVDVKETSSNDYSFKHFSSSDISYYRLKVISTEGQKYSNIVQLSRENLFTIYPNPFKNELLILQSTEEEATIYIQNVLGQEVYKGIVSHGNNIIPTQGFADGTYIVTIQSETNTFVEKLIKSTK